MEFTFEPAVIHLGSTVTFRVSKEKTRDRNEDVVYFVVAADGTVLARDVVQLRGDTTPFMWTPTASGESRVLVFRRDQTADRDSILNEAPVGLSQAAIAGPLMGTVTWGGTDFFLEHREALNVLAPQFTTEDTVRVQLRSSEPDEQPQDILNRVIFEQSGFLAFDKFDVAATTAVCAEAGRSGRQFWFGEAAYEALRDAALRFVDEARGTPLGPLGPLDLQDDWKRYVIPPDNGVIPYIDRIRRNAVTRGDEACPPELEFPGTELIWSYWHEEGMLVQTLHHILARFQNRKVAGSEPLARFDVNPLLPLRNLLWGFAEDEFRRLTVRRRAAEYQYEYGLQLIGRAVPSGDTVVESRTRFLEAFHSLLHSTAVFFKEVNDLTVRPDAFAILNALRETHLVLAQGAHNQFADLPRRARAEMLAMQWILARPEMREFLGGRPSVPYQEDWMDRVDTMKSIYGWTDVTVTHFRDLAVFGEQLVLSIRLGNWNDTAIGPDVADTWARFWRNAIQGYVHAYRAVTGIDLNQGFDATMPSALLASRSRQPRPRRV